MQSFKLRFKKHYVKFVKFSKDYAAEPQKYEPQNINHSLNYEFDQKNLKKEQDYKAKLTDKNRIIIFPSNHISNYDLTDKIMNSSQNVHNKPDRGEINLQKLDKPKNLGEKNSGPRYPNLDFREKVEKYRNFFNGTDDYNNSSPTNDKRFPPKFQSLNEEAKSEYNKKFLVEDLKTNETNNSKTDEKSIIRRHLKGYMPANINSLGASKKNPSKPIITSIVRTAVMKAKSRSKSKSPMFEKPKKHLSYTPKLYKQQQPKARFQKEIRSISEIREVQNNYHKYNKNGRNELKKTNKYFKLIFIKCFEILVLMRL